MAVKNVCSPLHTKFSRFLYIISVYKHDKCNFFNSVKPTEIDYKTKQNRILYTHALYSDKYALHISTL